MLTGNVFRTFFDVDAVGDDYELLETGTRARDKRERVLTDRELQSKAENCIKYLNETYPKFRCKIRFTGTEYDRRTINDLGMDYRSQDYAVGISGSFKHCDSKNIDDGYFEFNMRDFDEKVFRQVADDYFGQYEVMKEIPEEVILDVTYYGLVGFFSQHLNGEELARGTSLLTGKIGEKLFSDDFTLIHDATDEEAWFNTFWDGDGCVFENDKLVLVENGVLKTGYADKKTAREYNIPHTGPAYDSFSDIPGVGGLNLRIARSGKTVKELLDGRLCVVPVDFTSSGFNEKGEYTMLIQNSLLFDGEKVLGRLPEFKIVSTVFDMFGKDFIGVSSDRPIYYDKQLLVRVNLV
jgi:PmbA protein